MSKLSGLAMWTDWQERVKAALPNFAACPIYVEQNSVPENKFVELAEKLKHGAMMTDLDGRMRDAEFGARMVDTPALGKVSRMWLEANVEIDFLRRHIPSLGNMDVLDIGAGYGRLAVPLAGTGANVSCVDAVPISTIVCRQYTQRFAPSVKVLSLGEFEASYKDMKFDLAINVHSWNECSLEQIENWLDVICEMRVPFLFTVSHGQLIGFPETPYRSCGGEHPSFRPALEKRFKLVAEEALGLSDSPHALWLRK